MSQRYKLTIEYDGRPFVGWQRQDNGPSVQSALEEAIFRFSRERATVHGAGRTDAGVHARAMVAHMDLVRPHDAFRVMEALNWYLRQADIGYGAVTVLACAAVDERFHARFSAHKRRYTYRIINRRAPLALDRGRAWHVITPLDGPLMHEAAQILVGRHDFSTFRSAHCQAHSPVRTLDGLNVTQQGEEIVIEAEAKSFLHHQVRSMVGCLKMVGCGQWRTETLRQALAKRNRAALGLNAPPDGLYFTNVLYADLD